MDLFQYYNSVDCFIKSKPKRPNQRLFFGVICMFNSDNEQDSVLLLVPWITSVILELLYAHDLAV